MKRVFVQFLTNTVTCVSLFFSSMAVASPDINNKSSISVWKDVPAIETAARAIGGQTVGLDEKPSALNARTLELDETGLNAVLKTLDLNSHIQTITLPLPETLNEELKLEKIRVMSPELEQQFPDIKTWKVSGLNRAISGRISFSLNGFHGMLLMPDGDTVFIEPESNTRLSGELSSNARYVSFSKKSNKEHFRIEFSCGVHSNQHPVDNITHGVGFNIKRGNSSIASRAAQEGDANALQTQARPASNLLTYRLAIAATGEYTQFHGGTKLSALSSIVATINRVNSVYERDLGIRFELVTEQMDLIYTNPFTDPYTGSNVNAMLRQNITNLSSNGVLSRSQFDIGHVFGAQNVGGLAQFGSACIDNVKAGGVSSISRPENDAFILDYVAHELGHQLGASHTFNSACGQSQRVAATAVEPGSGTSIMSYAGICPGNNIQGDVDSQFHAVSIAQMTLFAREGAGNCAVSETVSNEEPTVDVLQDFAVPARTAILLAANASDADNDDLTYSWEQLDAGSMSDLNIDLGDNAIFRSRPPSSFGIRSIPRISNLLVGFPSDGEFMPVTNRDVDLAVTVRDGNGGVQGETVTMRVIDTGTPFSVTSHRNSASFVSGSTQSATWDVAGTNVAPISCSEVNIDIIGLDNDDDLASIFIATTANDGQHSMTIPSSVSGLRLPRLRVACSNNTFYSVSMPSGVLSGFFNGAPSSDNVDTGSSGGGSIVWSSLLLFVLLYIRKRFSFKSLIKAN